MALVSVIYTMNFPLETLNEVLGQNHILKFFGDSLYFQIEDGRVKMKTRIWPFFVLILTGIVTSGYMIYTQALLTWMNDKSFSEVINAAKSINMGYTDTFAIFTFIFLNLMYMLCCGLMTFKLAKHMTLFSNECYDVAEKHGISIILPEMGRKNWKIAVKRIILIFCLSFIAILFLSGAMFQYQKKVFEGKRALRCQLMRVRSNSIF